MPELAGAGVGTRRVCFVIEKIAERSGGAERVLIETTNALAARGHTIEILSHENRGRKPFYPLALGVIHTNLYRPKAIRGTLRQRIDEWRDAKHKAAENFSFPRDRLQWLSQHGAFWRRLERHLEVHRPDVAIAFLPPAITALGLIRPRYPLRRIASVHNVPEHDFCSPDRWDPNPLDRRRRMEALAQHDAITVLLPEFRGWFPAGLAAKVAIVPNAVKPVSRARIRRFERQRTVLSIGRLAPVKRHGLLIDAWARLAAEFPDWTLKIFGIGPLKAELAARIRAQDLGGRVRLMGHTDAIDEAYLSAAILVHPAEYEGWGLAVTEALAAGVPAIAFEDCPGPNQLIRHGTNGLLVTAAGDRTGNLAAALAELMRDEGRRTALADAAPATVSQYAPEAVIDRWESLLSPAAQPG